EIVREVELGRGALGDADGGAVELLGALHAELLRHHEALAVVVDDGREVEAEIGLARERRGRVAREHVDLAGLERREPVLAGGRHVLDLLGIAQHGRGDRTADLGIETRVLALLVRQRESGKTGRDAAGERARGLYLVERRPRRRSMARYEKCEDTGENRQTARVRRPHHSLLPRLGV